MSAWHPGPNSLDLFNRARQRIPGGVNSPVRAFKAVGGEPYFVARAQGAHVWDVDGHRYIDYLGSWGPMLLGHAHPAVLAAIVAAAQGSTSFGAPHQGEVELAELVCSLVPNMEMVRLVSSGTEATMSAARLARAATGRHKIIKLDGCYHGHADMFLIKAGSGAATFGQPDSPGVTPGTAADTLVAGYNDLDATRALFEQNPGQVAALFVEPVAGNMGCVPPRPGYLEGLRALCDQHGALLVFDEVITGFRVALGGAQQRYGVRADLVTLGKILGGGLPMGAYGGRREIMEQVAPAGPMYQAGTLSGNPLAVAAGLTMLKLLRDDTALYATLEARGKRLADGIGKAAAAAGLPCSVAQVGSLLGFHLVTGPVRGWHDIAGLDRAQFAKLFTALLQRGVSIAPSAFEAMFVSAAHDDAIVDETLEAFGEAMREVAA